MSNYSEEKKKISISSHMLFTLLAATLALGIFIGAGFGIFTFFPTGKGAASAYTEGTFKFIRASLKSEPSKELKPFRYKVAALSEALLKNHDVFAVSIYFRDLNQGSRFVIGERHKSFTKNLLKLPLMIAYFKWAESSPLVLRKKLTYTVKEEKERKHHAPVKELEPGTAYTVNDLIYRMIAYDDDAAYTLLQVNLPVTRLEKVFKDLDVEYDPNKEENSLSLNSVAAFYRVLFNASYLSEEMSEKALRYLSLSSFRDDMASGVPPNIDVASKYGERTITTTAENKEQKLYQLHEFGIIYHPNRPFLLGIMVQGKDFSKLEDAVRDITRLVYKEIDLQS